MKSFKKVLKIIGKILLIFIVVLVASSIISSVSFTDKLFAEIYMLRFGTDTEYVGEEIECSGYLMSKKEYRKKTYYDKKNDFEFHLYCGDVLLKNRVTSDDYYKYKLRKEAEDILVEEVLEPVLKNDYFIVMEGFRHATKKDNLENSETVADIFTWAENDFDEMGTKVIEKIEKNTILNSDESVTIYIFDNEEAYENTVKYVEQNGEETISRIMTHNISEENIDIYDTIIYCYSGKSKWMNGQ